MGTYLKDGWFEHSDSQKLRSDVIDGAMDLAGSFLRANVSAQTLQDIALKARASFTLIDPQMRGGVELTAADRERIIDRLGIDPAGPPELYAFVADCVEHLQEHVGRFED